MVGRLSGACSRLFIPLLFLFLAPVNFTSLDARPYTLRTVILIGSPTHFVSPIGSDANPGTKDRPWATINHAADLAVAGDVIVVRGGTYPLSEQVRPRNSGRPGAWITFVGFPGEVAVLDAQSVPQLPFVQRKLNNGAFQLEGLAYIRVANLAIENSHDAGFTVRDSSDIDLINNRTKGTYSSGIAVWDTNHDDNGTERIRVLGNSVERATSWEFASDDVPRGGQTPHEAISVGGAVDFEVAYNRVYNSDKEGIDIKETSKRGRVHHNLVERVPRQGIYLDAWFGEVSDVAVTSNVVRNCGGAGIAVSVENGKSVSRVSFVDNLVSDNSGSGMYFSRWGVDGERKHILVANNVFYHNGYGPVAPGQQVHWQTGGLYLYSSNIQDASIKNNVFSENRGFQIGYSELYLTKNRSWEVAKRKQGIRILHNLIDDREGFAFPIESGGNPPDQVKIYGVEGDLPLRGDPLFENPVNQIFALKQNSPALKEHILSRSMLDSLSQNRWEQDFPPQLFRLSIIQE
jgi:Right handed beta helix region